MPARAVVLYYHSIPNEQSFAFTRQMDEVVRWTKPLRADARASLEPCTRYTVVTFDDGLQDNIDNALPVLVEKRIPATFFIVTEALGRTPSWKSYSVDSAGREREPIMTAEELRKLPPDLIQIGSQTRTHPMLPQLSEQEARLELRESRRKLSEITKTEVKLFCFPYGAFTSDLITWCREEGYERVFTTLPYPAFSEPAEFVVGRVRSDPDDWLLEFRLKLFGAYRWLPLAFSLKRTILSKLVLAGAKTRSSDAANI